MVRPIVAFIDDLRQREEEQIMVLIPVAVPERIRYLFLHNHLDLVLERALRARTDVVIGRVQVPLHDEVGAQVSRRASDERRGDRRRPGGLTPARRRPHLARRRPHIEIWRFLGAVRVSGCGHEQNLCSSKPRSAKRNQIAINCHPSGRREPLLSIETLPVCALRRCPHRSAYRSS